MSSYTRFDGSVSLEYALDTTMDGGLYPKLDRWYVTREFLYYTHVKVDWTYTDSPFNIVIPKGFLTDGASVPRLFWSLLPPLGKYGNAAIVHDYLCESIERRHAIGGILLTQKVADRIFLEAMKVSKVPSWKRYLMYAAVRFYGRFIRGRVVKQTPFELASFYRAKDFYEVRFRNMR